MMKLEQTEAVTLSKVKKEMDYRYIPWIIFFSTMFVVATVYMTQPIMVVLSRYYEVPIDRISVAMSVVSMMYALSFVFYGSISDKFGRRPLLLFGVIVLAIIMVVIPFAPTFQSFLWITAVQGVAAGALPAVAIPYMADITPKERLGQAMGIALSGTIAGTVLGRSLSGLVTQSIGWHNTYLLYAVLLVISFVFLVRLPNNNRRNSEISVIRTLGNTFGLFANVRILLLLFVGAGLFFAYLGSATFLTPYLAAPPFNFGPGVIGLLGTIGVVGILASPLAGKLVVKYGSFRVMLAGLVLVLLAIQLMAYVPSVWMIIGGLALLYIGVFVCQPAVMSLITVVAPVERRGGASALYLLACMGGGSLGAYLLRSAYLSMHWQGVALISSGVCLFSLLLAVIYSKRYAK